MEEALKHLEHARTERRFYRHQCHTAASEWEAFTSGTSDKLQEMHYSYDYAQQLHYPVNAQQTGPEYFKTARKCNLFGVCCEASSFQVNYLIDEADDIGKGADATVSMLHHFFENHSLKESNVHLHADNCTAQNKNNANVHYLLWRALTGRHKSLTLSFMLVGHTKFAPDRFFGLIKRKYRMSTISSMIELERVVKESSVAGINIPQPVRDRHDTQEVVWYRWSAHLLKFFKTIPNILSYHSFRVSEKNPGTVYLKQYSDSEESSFYALKDGIGLTELNTT